MKSTSKIEQKTQYLQRNIYALITVILFISIFFIVWPEIDIYVARLFYIPETRNFWGKQSGIIRFLHFSIPVMAKILAIVGLAHMFYFSFFKPNKERFREGLYFCVSYAAIPGVWINLLLKDQWGRPRPSQTIIFGGDYPFSAAYVITGLSKQYGSFVSGHVALAMFVMAVGVFLDRSREPLWICGGVVYALVMSVVRIAEGGHYLSDVFLGGSMTFLGVLLAKRLYLRAPQL